MLRLMQSLTDQDRLAAIQLRIDQALQTAGRPAGACQLIVVSKTQSAERLVPLVQAGSIELGENYLSEAVPKIEALPKGQIWHYIGSIQSNKTRPIAEHFDWVHTLDREKIAQRLNDQRPGDRPPLNVLIQVNLDGEASKAGCAPEQVQALADAIAGLPNLCLRGLMSIPKADQSDPGQPHRRLAALLDSLKPAHPTCDCLSMGMSGDLEPAVLAGATHVRIGTAIFGPRPAKEAV